MKYTIRKSLKGNYGIFHWTKIGEYKYVRYPICKCPDCRLGCHPVNDSMVKMGWVAIYVAANMGTGYDGHLTCCKFAEAMGIKLTSEVEAQS